MGICVGRYPYFASIGERPSGPNTPVINPHAPSLSFEVSATLSHHPPLIVLVEVFLYGTGSIGIIPTCSSGTLFVRDKKYPGNHEPPSITAYFLSTNSFSKSTVIGLTPMSTSCLKNSSALTPSVLLYIGNQCLSFVGCPCLLSSMSPPSIHRNGNHSFGDPGPPISSTACIPLLFNASLSFIVDSIYPSQVFNEVGSTPESFKRSFQYHILLTSVQAQIPYILSL